MPGDQEYSTNEPPRSEIDALAGPAVIEFGNAWCGHCRRAAPLIHEAFANHPAVRHIRIADAGGRRLGRSFAVKLWPTLIFLKDGTEVARLVRPRDADTIRDALPKIDPAE
jgi:thioredoxin 1